MPTLTTISSHGFKVRSRAAKRQNKLQWSSRCPISTRAIPSARSSAAFRVMSHSPIKNWRKSKREKVAAPSSKWPRSSQLHGHYIVRVEVPCSGGHRPPLQQKPRNYVLIIERYYTT